MISRCGAIALPDKWTSTCRSLLGVGGTTRAKVVLSHLLRPRLRQWLPWHAAGTFEDESILYPSGALIVRQAVLRVAPC